MAMQILCMKGSYQPLRCSPNMAASQRNSTACSTPNPRLQFPSRPLSATFPLMKHVKDMVAAANAEVAHPAAAELLDLHGTDGVTFVDLRDPRELDREGMIPGAFHCPRGMLEFWIDPESPYAKEVFQSGNRFVFYCASGWRSALSAKTAQDMGLEGVSHISDGFSGWKASGGPVGQKG